MCEIWFISVIFHVSSRKDSTPNRKENTHRSFIPIRPLTVGVSLKWKWTYTLSYFSFIVDADFVCVACVCLGVYVFAAKMAKKLITFRPITHICANVIFYFLCSQWTDVCNKWCDWPNCNRFHSCDPHSQSQIFSTILHKSFPSLCLSLACSLALLHSLFLSRFLRHTPVIVCAYSIWVLFCVHPFQFLLCNAIWWWLLLWLLSRYSLAHHFQQ